MKLKRLRDTTTKQMVLIRDPQGKKSYQVWTNDDGSKLYVYNSSQWMEYNPETSEVPAEVYWPGWKNVGDDDVVGVYDTNEPTDFYTWESGDDVSYVFKNGTTTLQSWKVKEGQTPEYTGETPTKEATAQYTYTFDDWNPEIWPIYKKTTFKATYTSTVNEYTVDFASADDTMGSVNLEEVTNIPYGTAINVAGDTITIGSGDDAAEIVATPEEWYEFDKWLDTEGQELPATVQDNLSVDAYFKEIEEPEEEPVE